MNAPNSPYRPLLTNAARPATFDVSAVDEHGESRAVPIAGEHPLTMYVDKQEILTLMTLGAAPEDLTIGYLRNQRLVERIEDIVAVQVDWETNSVAVKTRNGLADLEAKTAKRTKTTGCGQGTVFGDLMDDIDSVRLPPDATLTRTALYELLDQVRVHETIYKQAGAVHGCALATETERAGAPDGFIYEELAEIALARRDAAAAKPWAARAYALLKEDIWIKANEQKRLTRLAELGGVTPDAPVR